MDEQNQNDKSPKSSFIKDLVRMFTLSVVMGAGISVGTVVVLKTLAPRPDETGIKSDIKKSKRK